MSDKNPWLYRGKRETLGDTVTHVVLMASVQSLRYYPAYKVGVVVMADNSCVDMGGCIETFRGIDPQVNRIFTFQRQRLDTSYVLYRGNWLSLTPDEYATAEHIGTGELNLARFEAWLAPKPSDEG